MSLTSNLRGKQSPIRQVFDARLPHFSPVVQQVRKLIRTKKTLVPNASYTPYEHMLIGAAFDYRARLYFKKFNLKNTIAFQGAQISEQFGNGVMAHCFKYFVSPNYSYWLKQMRPKDCKQTPTVEEGLLQQCVLLARFDELRRAPDPAILAYETGEIRGIEDLMDRTRQEYIEDLKRLSYLFYASFRDQFRKRVVLNPNFAGSIDVGGADADIIVGRQLVDFKCTINSNLPADQFKRAIFQLLGYALLDYDNEYRIEEIGIYYARQGLMWSAPIDVLLGELSDGKIDDIAKLRFEFLELLGRRLAYNPPTPPPSRPSALRPQDHPPA